MADVSRQSLRNLTQERITNNRDAILPTRRDNDLPRAQVRADMRNGYVSDGGRLDEIRRVLGLTNDAAEAYIRADLAQTEVQADEDFAAGMTDASTGAEMDPARAQAVAYQRAYYSVNASARQSAFEREMTAELDRMTNAGATVEDIETYTRDRSIAFIQETTDLFDHDDVRQQVGTRMLRWSHSTNAQVSTALKERTDRELMDLTVGEVQAALAAGEDVDILGQVDTLVAAGLDRNAVMDDVVNGVITYAQETGDTEALGRLLDMRRGGDLLDSEVPTEAAPEAAASEPVAPEPEPAPAPAPEPQVFRPPVPEGTRVSSGSGARRAPLPGASTNHVALDYAVPVGTPVGAAAGGVVEFAGNRGRGGNTVIIRHDDDTTTGYAHLDSINVEVGQTVTQGDVVALSGNTGNSTGPHLHFTVRRGGVAVDPTTVFGQPAPGAPATAVAPVENAEAVPAETRRPRAPGVAVLTPAQQARVMSAMDGVEGRNERLQTEARAEAKDDLLLDLWNRNMAGESVDTLVQDAVHTGILTPQEGMTVGGAYRSYRNYLDEGEADEDLVLGYAARFAVPEPNYSAITASATADYEAGRFGVGRAATRSYLEIVNRAAAGSRADRGIPPEERRAATVARSYVAGSLSNFAGIDPDPVALRISAEAMIDYERRVANNTDPMTAADEVLAAYRGRFSFAGPAPSPTANGGGGGRTPGANRTASTSASTALRYNPSTGSLE
jgi:murein DD-endopeptidase